MEALAIIGLIVGVIAAVAGYASSENTNATNVRLTRETNEVNQRIADERNDLQRQLAAEAREWDLAQWNRENEYNTMVNQMSRLREAGANPALAYANGGLMNEAAASPASTMANVEAIKNMSPHIDKPVTPDPVAASQIALNTAQAQSLNDANARAAEMQPYTIESIKAATEVSETLAKVNMQSIEESMSRIAVNRETASKLSEEAYSFVLDNKFKLDTMSMRERLVANQSTISDYEVEYFKTQADQSLAESKAMCEKLLAEAEAARAKSQLDASDKQYIDKQVEYYQTTLDYIVSQTNKLKSEASLNDIEKQVNEKYKGKKAEQELKRIKQERISGYVNMVTSGVRDVGVAFGSVMHGLTGKSK